LGEQYQWSFAGQTFSQGGYLIKIVNIKTINTTSVGADLEEITKFQTKLATTSADGEKMDEEDEIERTFNCGLSCFFYNQ